jgi:dTDP-4-dehydrorhamnose 3,5-epimerase
MTVLDEVLHGVKLLKPKVFEDQRGYFYESYNQKTFHDIGIYTEFLQDNQSLSAQPGVLRGLHFQNPPFAQTKLVRVVRGAVWDVVVDIRAGSPTYGQHYAVELSEHNKLMLYIPEGFAHGFATLEPNTLFNYKCSEVYNKGSEGGIAYNDPDLGINWKVENPILSEKDTLNPLFSAFKSHFTFPK